MGHRFGGAVVPCDSDPTGELVTLSMLLYITEKKIQVLTHLLVGQIHLAEQLTVRRVGGKPEVLHSHATQQVLHIGLWASWVSCKSQFHKQT